MFGYFDYILYMLPALLVALVAQIMVKSAFSKYSRVASSRGLTGEQAAKAVLQASGVFGVGIRRVSGHLTDHYDPRDNTINLSESVFSSTSVASIGVAAHEAGHAVQYSEGYAPIKIRAAIIPICNFGSSVGLLLMVISFAISFTAATWSVDALYYVGLILFSLSALFELVTLPVEINASRRAIESLEASDVLAQNEIPMAKRVLKAAALTYVAALLTSIMQIFYYASRFRRDD